MKNGIFEQNIFLKTIFLSLFMLSFFSCDKEALVENLHHIDNSIADRDDGPDEEGCQCEMQIISVNNPPDGVFWQIDDVTNGTALTNELFYGFGEYVISQPLMSNLDPFYQVMDIPTHFMEINSGNPTFSLEIFMDADDLPAKFSISTRIVCTITDTNGNSSEIQYFFDFVPAAGIQGPTGGGASFFIFPLPFSILEC